MEENKDQIRVLKERITEYRRQLAASRRNGRKLKAEAEHFRKCALEMTDSWSEAISALRVQGVGREEFDKLKATVITENQTLKKENEALRRRCSLITYGAN